MIVQGLQNILHISLSREELNLLTSHLDEDNSGDIDFKEFTNKISLNNMHINSHRFLISEYRFIDFVLKEWYDYRSAQKKEIVLKIK